MQDLEEEEYKETKAETLKQLEEFQRSLNRLVSGDVTLVDSLGALQLATQAAVSGAFRTTEVIKLFALKQPGQLRERLTVLQRDLKLGKVQRAKADQEMLEILAALRKLGSELTAEEAAYMQEHVTSEIQALEQAMPAGGVSAEVLTGHLRQK